MSHHFAGINPARLEPAQIEAYLLHLVKERQLSYSSVNHAASACRFLFEACTNPAHRMLLQVLYASGLRISEACHLQVADIDSSPDRMTLPCVPCRA